MTPAQESVGNSLKGICRAHSAVVLDHCSITDRPHQLQALVLCWASAHLQTWVNTLNGPEVCELMISGAVCPVIQVMLFYYKLPVAQTCFVSLTSVSQLAQEFHYYPLFW